MLSKRDLDFLEGKKETPVMQGTMLAGDIRQPLTQIVPSLLAGALQHPLALCHLYWRATITPAGDNCARQQFNFDVQPQIVCGLLPPSQKE
jgi:hypothetical protein